MRTCLTMFVVAAVSTSACNSSSSTKPAGNAPGAGPNEAAFKDYMGRSKGTEAELRLRQIIKAASSAAAETSAYIEGQTAWSQGAIVAIGSVHPLYFCPSRRDPQSFQRPDKYKPPLTGGTLTHALSDYAAGNREQTGIVRRFTPLKIAEVTDGLSHTLLLGDKRLNVRQLGEPQDDDNEGYTVGWNEDTIRRTDEPPRPDHDGGEDGEKLFGSSHPAACNVALADGSVHSVSYEIAAEAFERLGNRSDGQGDAAVLQ